MAQPGRRLADFSQYEHLDTLKRLIDDDDTGTLAAAIGRDYEVKPDVTVAYQPPDSDIAMLHASVSCKFTIRSDRAQNVRQESSVLTRLRVGRLPHVVAVTAEPMPSRLASLARGTGEIDAVYHLALSELYWAVMDVGTDEQMATLDEMLSLSRLKDVTSLPVDLSY